MLVPNDDLQTVCFGRGDLYVSGMLGKYSGMTRESEAIHPNEAGKNRQTRSYVTYTTKSHYKESTTSLSTFISS
jgi:hypothetical protein